MNTIGLNDRCAVISGAAGGIGFAAAKRLLASGAAVTLWDRDPDALAKAQSDLSGLGTVFTDVVDLCDADQVVDAAAAAKRTLGKIDILVNSAGVAGNNASLWETGHDEWHRVLDINLHGTFHCCRAIIPHMIRNGYGRIVNMASIAGKEGNAAAAHYAASKAAVIALTKSLGKELADTGIVCNALAPALIDTAIVAQSTPEFIKAVTAKIPMGRLGRVEEVAALIAWLSSEDCSFSTGATFDVSGGRATY